jgi:hypothetical protein
MATVQQLKPQNQAEDAVQGVLAHQQTLQSYRQLSMHSTTRQSRLNGINRMYQRLARFFQVEPDPLHMVAYPTALESLPDDLLVLAFERAEEQITAFCPLPGKLRELVASDNAAQIEELWRHEWMQLLPAIKAHGRVWRDKSRLDLSNPRQPKNIPIKPPSLTQAMQRAIQVLGGTNDWRDGIQHIQFHPFFYGTEPGDFPGPDSPRLAADRIEKKVRDLWEVYR